MLQTRRRNHKYSQYTVVYFRVAFHDKQHLSSPVTHFPNLRKKAYLLGPRSDCYLCNPLRPGVSIRVPFCCRSPHSFKARRGSSVHRPPNLEAAR